MRSEELLERQARGGVAAVLDDGNWISMQPVPAWSHRTLRPGEWREREEEGGEVKRRKKENGTFYSKEARVSAVAAAAGIFTVRYNTACGVRTKYRVRRVEQGADVSGVT